MSETSEVVARLARIEAQLERLATTPAPVAVKRSVAAKMMGVSLPKLVRLIAAGKVKTADDEHLIPVAEVRRYCAPKASRQRKAALGYRARQKHVDGQSEEAITEMRRRLRAGGVG